MAEAKLIGSQHPHRPFENADENTKRCWITDNLSQQLMSGLAKDVVFRCRYASRAGPFCMRRPGVERGTIAPKSTSPFPMLLQRLLAPAEIAAQAPVRRRCIRVLPASDLNSKPMITNNEHTRLRLFNKLGMSILRRIPRNPKPETFRQPSLCLRNTSPSRASLAAGAIRPGVNPPA